VKIAPFDELILSQDCRLCAALIDGEVSESPSPFNKIFRGWNEQIMIPARGQLIPNHALIITRRHYSSYGNATTDVKSEYREIEENARETFPDFLEVEHGASRTGKGGGCITHSHIHWYHGLGDLLPIIASNLNLAPKARTRLEEKTCGETPYLELRNKSQSVKVYRNFNEGQIARKIVADALNMNIWDWRTMPEVAIENPLQGWEGL